MTTDVDDLECELAIADDKAWFAAHVDREWRCRRAWQFELKSAERCQQYYTRDWGPLLAVVHRTEVLRGIRFCLQLELNFDPATGNDAFCRQLATREWRYFASGQPFAMVGVA